MGGEGAVKVRRVKKEMRQDGEVKEKQENRIQRRRESTDAVEGKA